MALRTFIAGAMALASLACAPAEPPPDMHLSNGWTREIAPGQSSAAIYLTIGNKGGGSDRLDTVEATLGEAGLHATSSTDGIARMRWLDNGLVIDARSTVELKPGGTHIMLTGLQQPLKLGETIALDLGFRRSGRRAVRVRVVAAGGDAHSGHAM